MNEESISFAIGAAIAFFLTQLPGYLFISRDPDAATFSREELVEEFPHRERLVGALFPLTICWGLATVSLMRIISDTGNRTFDLFFMPLLFLNILQLGNGVLEVLSRNLTLDISIRAGPGSSPAGGSRKYITVSKYAYQSGWLRISIVLLVIVAYFIGRNLVARK
jgi:hypothetical protein